MASGQRQAIAIFRSRSTAMLFYDDMKKNTLKCELVSAPARLAMGCGVAVVFARTELARVLSYNAKNRYRIAGIYDYGQRQDSTYERLF